MAGSAYSILVDVQLDTSSLQKQLSGLGSSINLSANSSGISAASSAVDGLSSSMKNAGLTYQEANMIFDKSVTAIGAMVDQVFEMDSALTEFKKVSELDSSSLDSYVAKMTELGDTVARTGQSFLGQNVQMVNVH